MHPATRFASTLLLAVLLVLATADSARADDFADEVVSFAPGLVSGNPAPAYLGAANALGAPDHAGVNTCSSTESCTFVTLGDGGNIVLRFVDNALTGSDSADPDLWIYEIGPDVEDTFVEISADGVAWEPVGKVFGSTSTVDIDAFGFGTGDMFFYVRLTDDPDEGAQSGSTVGADIDAIEALSTIPIPVQSVSWGSLKTRY